MPANFAEIAVQCLSAPLSAAEAVYIAHIVKNIEGIHAHRHNKNHDRPMAIQPAMLTSALLHAIMNALVQGPVNEKTVAVG